MCRETGLCPEPDMTAMTMCRPDVAQVSAFLAEYGAWLLGSGATCIRLEKNVGRIAAAWGAEADMSIMPRHIHLSVRGMDGGEPVISVVATRVMPVDYDINTRLSRLSWDIADGRAGYAQARAAMRRVLSARGAGAFSVMVLVSLANAAFCRLFGGDGPAMAIVMVATMAGMWLKGRMLSAGIDSRAVWFVCAFVSSVLGSTGLLFPFGTAPHVALATSVLYLVPGILFLNSFSDMLYRHYICAFSRFADALVLTCCLSAGLCAGMALMQAGMF